MARFTKEDCHKLNPSPDGWCACRGECFFEEKSMDEQRIQRMIDRSIQERLRGAIRDERERLADILVASAGSTLGTRAFARSVAAELRVELLFEEDQG